MKNDRPAESLFLLLITILKPVLGYFSQ